MNGKINADSKKKVRQEMKRCLSAFHALLSQKEKHALSEQLCQRVTSLTEYKNADVIFAYIPAALEADCTPVIVDALESDKLVAVPKVDATSLKTGENTMDFYVLDKNAPIDSQIEVGTYGIREPKSNLKKVNCNELTGAVFVIVPGVAFTRDGRRLGHGKAFYDNFIAKMRQAGVRPFLCGVCLPCQIVEDIPTEPHDVLMDKIVF